MSDGTHKRRVIVAFDASEMSRQALEAAARLAAEIKAELVGVFVVDEDLIAAAALPVTRLVARGTSRLEAFDDKLMRRALRLLGEEARQGFASVATRWQVSYSFSMAQGRAAEQILTAASAEDVLAFASASSRHLGRRLGSTARSLVAGAACSMMVMTCGPARAGEFVIVHEKSIQTLHQALALARGLGANARVVLPVEDESAATQELLAALRADESVVQSAAVVEAVPLEQLSAHLRQLTISALFLERGSDLARESELEKMLGAMNCGAVILGC